MDTVSFFKIFSAYPIVKMTNSAYDKIRFYLYFCYNKQQIKERTRKAEHPQGFLKGFKGVVVTDGYSAYQKIDKENPDITFAGCYAHCRRKFSDVLKGLKGKQKENAKTTVAYQALQQIAAIYHLDNSDRSFLDDLLLWSKTLPDICRSSQQK